MKQALATACTTLFTILRSGTNNRDSVVFSRLVGLRSRLILSRMSSGTTDSTTGNQYDVVVDPFCFRQFEESEKAKGYSGTVFKTSIAKFEAIVNSRYDASLLKEGYAPFCKHLFIENDFTDAQVNVLEITLENEHLLRTSYEARNEKELPVSSVKNPLPVGKYLDLILYSRDQINKENAAMGNDSNSDAPWGIVSIKSQDVDYELPMQPITSMRNALGEEHGGSGVPIDRNAYMTAYNYWKNHAVVS